MDWEEWAKMLGAGIIGAGGGLLSGRALMARVKSQNHVDDANAFSTLSKTVTDLSARLAETERAHDVRMDELRAQLTSDIEAKDIRLKRLESDVISLKKSLSEWRAYAMGLFDMLIKLGHRPHPPPDTGPLKP